MSFSLDEFYQRNRRALIWLILIGIIWLLRDFFGLIFLTFVLAFIAGPAMRWGQFRLRLPAWAALVVIYLCFLVALGSFVRYVVPSVAQEANRFLSNLGAVQQKIVELKTSLSTRYPGMDRPLRGYLRSLLDDRSLASVTGELEKLQREMGLDDTDLAQFSHGPGAPDERKTKLKQYHDREIEILARSLMAQQMDRLREYTPRLINLVYGITTNMLLALLFSFLILLDFARLNVQMRSLGSSRLRDFYQETAQPVVRFAYVIGRALQAQAIIAGVNTLLTLIGMVILSIPSLTLLTLIVFVYSFIPVLGVFISTIPILLVALNVGGLPLALGVVIMVALVHTVVAFLLTPLIYGKHFMLNPVLVLIILIIAYHGFGLWGMVLGVPIAHYFIHDVFGVPLWDEQHMQPNATD